MRRKLKNTRNHSQREVRELVEEIEEMIGSENGKVIDPVEEMIAGATPDIEGKELIFYWVHMVEDNKSIADDCVRIANRCRKGSQQ